MGEFLALGSLGPPVADLHARLVANGYQIEERELKAQQFGLSTDAAVRRFQTQSKITCDGIAGSKTLTALSLPHRLAPHGIEEIRREYGNIRLSRINGRMDVVSPRGWEDFNCVLVKDLPGYDRPLYCHKKIVIPLRDALAAAQMRAVSYKIKTMGCFNPRMKRTSAEQYSCHSWAVAVDINADTNPQRNPLTTDMPREFVSCFTELGWTWGGKFPVCDPQHFQFCSGY